MDRVVGGVGVSVAFPRIPVAYLCLQSLVISPLTRSAVPVLYRPTRMIPWFILMIPSLAIYSRSQLKFLNPFNRRPLGFFLLPVHSALRRPGRQSPRLAAAPLLLLFLRSPPARLSQRTSFLGCHFLKPSSSSSAHALAFFSFWSSRASVWFAADDGTLASPLAW